MNNYYMPQGNNNYQANMLPNNNMNQQYNPMNNFYDPYQGFIRGDMCTALYQPYKTQQPFEVEPMNDQAKLLTDIDALTFATIDLNLYLDVNPNDKQAIDLFNQYRVQKEQLVNSYENQYGPLTLDSNALNTYPWAWDNRPWPWEN